MLSRLLRPQAAEPRDPPDEAHLLLPPLRAHELLHPPRHLAVHDLLPDPPFLFSVVGVLADALQNVRIEVGLFSELPAAQGLPPLGAWRERKATRDYTAEMARVGACGTLEDGLIFLWAMEHVSCQVHSLQPALPREQG